MCDAIQNTISTIIGGVLSAATGLGAFWLQRRSTARDEFLATVDNLRAKLPTFDHNPELFYSESRIVLRHATFKVRRHLGNKSKTLIDETLKEYENQEEWFKSPTTVLTLVAKTLPQSYRYGLRIFSADSLTALSKTLSSTNLYQVNKRVYES